MLDYKILFKKFIDDTRTIPFDEIFMKDIENMYKNALKDNLNNIYKNSPMFYNKITESDKIFNIYSLWFLAIFVIYYSNNNSLDKYKTKSDILSWTSTRNDLNIEYLIIGPLNNEIINLDFISHYKSIMNAQNTTNDINIYQQVSNLQVISSTLDEFKELFVSSPNAYNKLSNSVNAYTLNIDSKDIDLEIIDNMTTMNCSSLDIGDISDNSIEANYDSLYQEDSLKIQNSKIYIKKLENILNSYDRFHLIKFEIDSKAFDLKLDSFDSCYVVFDGLNVNSRNVYSDNSNNSLKILGSFSYDSIRNVFVFNPVNEYITYHKGESIVRKFNIYAYFPNIGNVNKTFELKLTYNNFNNVFINNTTNQTNTSKAISSTSKDSFSNNIRNINSTNNIRNIKGIFKSASKGINLANGLRNNHLKIINKPKDKSLTSFKNKALKVFNYAKQARNIDFEYDTINIDNYKFFKHNDVYYLAYKTYSLIDDLMNCSLFIDSTLSYEIISDSFEKLQKNHRLCILPFYNDYFKGYIKHEYYNITVYTIYIDYDDGSTIMIDTCSININDNIKIYITADDFTPIYNEIYYNDIEVFINYNSIYVDNQLVDNSYDANYKVHIKITKVAYDEIDILENNELTFKIHLITLDDNKHMFKIEGNNKTYTYDGYRYLGEWLFIHELNNYYEALSSFRVLSNNIYSYDELIKSLLHIDLSDIYVNNTDIEFIDIDMKTYENCSGLLLDNEFIECSKYIIKGTTLYILYENESIKFSKQYDVYNKKFTIFPSLEYESYIFSELTPFGYYKQKQDGFYEQTDEVTNMIGLKKIHDDERISVILCKFNDEYVLMLKDTEGNFDLTPFIINDSGILYYIFFRKTINGIDISYISNYNNRTYYMNLDKYIIYPTPILALKAVELFKYMNKKVDNYIRTELIIEYNYSDSNVFSFNELSINNYDAKYNTYPLITTDNNLITNRKYILTVDDNKYNGIILKAESNKYIFCTNDNITINKSSKIILKINDSLYKCSFYLD